MIGTSGGSQFERQPAGVRRQERGQSSSLGGVVPTMGTSSPSFACELATAHDGAPHGRDAQGTLSTWSKTLELARAGGGTARITLNTASGEPVELRVTVRGGRVTVLAHVTSRAAETSIRAMQETIARSLAEAGLCLHQLHVRQPGKRQTHLREHLRRHAATPSRREREREETP
jgi:hypothetical protein